MQYENMNAFLTFAKQKYLRPLLCIKRTIYSMLCTNVQRYQYSVRSKASTINHLGDVVWIFANEIIFFGDPPSEIFIFCQNWPKNSFNNMVLQEKRNCFLGLNWPNVFFFLRPIGRNFFSATLRTNVFFRFAPRSPPRWLMVDPKVCSVNAEFSKS